MYISDLHTASLIILASVVGVKIARKANQAIRHADPSAAVAKAFPCGVDVVEARG